MLDDGSNSNDDGPPPFDQDAAIVDIAAGAEALDDLHRETKKTWPRWRAAIVGWLGEVLGDPGIVTEHHGHHPEITLTSDGEARGTWYLQDRVIVPAADLEIGGTAFYEDRYRRTDEGWRIAHTGYTRVFEEQRTHSTLAVRSFTSRFGAPG